MSTKLNSYTLRDETIDSMKSILRIGKFGESNIKILNRNTGLLIKSMEKVMTKEECINQRTGTIQLGIENAWG